MVQLCAPSPRCAPSLPLAHASPPALPLRPPELQDLLPDIINQLGPDSISSIRKLAESYQAPATGAATGAVRPRVHVAESAPPRPL